ncbi:coiled-coil domain-containing protein 110 isoform X2 [Tachyglossus aculeatus]|nr:coiled-coil domain-containing protein 110 isoform X2 [Tachyglossus aculeatus]
MVQSEISEILSKNIVEMEYPQICSEKILLSSPPAERILPKENSEGGLSKEKTSYFEKFNLAPSEGKKSNSVAGNFIQGMNNPTYIPLKDISIRKTETLVKIGSPSEKCSGLKDCDNLDSIQPFPNQSLVTSTAKIILDESKKILPFPTPELWEDLEGMCGSAKLAKEGSQKSQEKDLILGSDLRTLKHVTGAQGESSEGPFKKHTEKAVRESCRTTRETPNGTQSGRVSEFEASIKKLNSVIVALKGSSMHLCRECGRIAERDGLSDLGHVTMQAEDYLGVFPLACQGPKDPSSLVDSSKHAIDREKQKPSSAEPENEASDTVKTRTDQYIAKIQQLQSSLKEATQAQKKLLELEGENLTLKMNIKPLVDMMKSVREKNAEYEKTIGQLVGSKKDLQVRLAKAEEGSRGCAQELAKLIKSYKELQWQNKTLEAESHQRCTEKQHLMQTIEDLKSKKETVQNEKAGAVEENERLNEAVAAAKKNASLLCEENQKLERRAEQLAMEKTALEKELEKNQTALQQLQEEKSVARSEREALLLKMRAITEEKVNLEATLRHRGLARQKLETESGDAWLPQASAAEKLRAELQNAKAETSIFKNGLSDVGRECEVLSEMVMDLQANNRMLNEELKKRVQENLECESNVRRLMEDKLLLENCLRTVENEKDALQFQMRHFGGDYRLLSDDISLQYGDSVKLGYISRKKKYWFEKSIGSCEEKPASKPKTSEGIPVKLQSDLSSKKC